MNSRRSIAFLMISMVVAVCARAADNDGDYNPFTSSAPAMTTTTTSAPATGPSATHRPPPLDARVAAAIEKGVKLLLAAQQKDGSWKSELTEPNLPGLGIGENAMIVYALLESGLVKPTDPAMKSALTWLQDNPTDFTYALAARAQAWLRATHVRAGDVKPGDDVRYLMLLAADATRVIRSTKDGSYTYNCPNTELPGSDNSNSQYAVLAVWAAYRADIDLAARGEYWNKIADYWAHSQNADGGWPYACPLLKPYYIEARPTYLDSTATMTCAGIASLFVCQDALLNAKQPRAAEHNKSLKLGLEWIDKHFPLVLAGGERAGALHDSMGYFFYGVERVGLASGYKYFGHNDWYRMGSQWLLDHARDNGWTDGVYHNVETAFSLLFLSHGNRPVVMNHLDTRDANDNDWNNYPRAAANFCRWYSRTYETNVNWQIVSLATTGPQEWHDAPVLTITGAKAPLFTAASLDKLRTYVQQGGTLFSIAEGGPETFTAGMTKVYKQLFPQYELTPAPANSPLYAEPYSVPGVKFLIVSNGVRPLAIHAATDLSNSWQSNSVQLRRSHFEAGANLFEYVTGRQLRNRAAKTWPGEPNLPSPAATIKVARLRCNESCNPEPLAWQRLARIMGEELNVKLDVTEPMEIQALPASGARLRTMSGTEAYTLSPADKAALKAFIEGGGTLVFDAAGGAKPFANSTRDLMTELFGDVREFIGPDHPLFHLKDLGIDKLHLRRPGHEAKLYAVTVNGRVVAFYSDFDITAGLVDYFSSTIDGYRPQSATDLMRNIVLYANGERP